MKKRLLQRVCVLGLLCIMMPLFAAPFGERKDVQQFIQEMHQKYQFKVSELTHILNQVKPLPEVTEMMNAPAEILPWHKYRPHFVTETKVSQGVAFWKQHKAILAHAEKKYGVPAPIIIAILGIESNYGKFTGQYRVLDTLSNFAFNYPKRANFFKTQLAEFLLLCREHHLQPTEILGSYAGAIGQPQFMPGSVRTYAISFKPGKHPDLINNSADGIMSIANYLHSHGWQPKDTLLIRATLKPDKKRKLDKLLNTRDITVDELEKQGVVPAHPLPPKTNVMLIQLQEADGPVYYLAKQNFKVILTYNSSINYAMVIYELGEAIALEYPEKYPPTAT